MNGVNNIPDDVLNIVPFAKFMAAHPVLTNVLLAIELIALGWAVFFYDFTTNF